MARPIELTVKGVGDMKVIQILRRIVFEEWGGTETVVWNLSRQLYQKNIDTRIVATQALCSRSEEVVEHIPIRRFPYFYPHFPLNAQQKKALDKKGGNPYSRPLYHYLKDQGDCDILHCHTMQRLANLVRRAARANKIPYIVSFHGGFFDVPKSEIQEMMKPLEHTINYGKFLDVLLQTNRFLNDADGILCVGYNEYETTRERFPGKLVEYLPNGVDVDKFQRGDGFHFRKKYNIPNDRQVILCLSRIDYQKNQLLLLELLHYLKQSGADTQLLLIGPISSATYYHKIQDTIARYALQEHCTIIPGLQADDPDLVSAYQAADYFILPSIHEPFGIVVLEAWSAGVPVIVSRVGGLQKLVRDQHTGLFFESESSESLIDTFKTLEKDKHLQERLRENAYAEVRNTYTWDIIAERLIDFYNKVIEHHARKNTLP